MGFFLSPDAGNAWFRPAKGGWTHVTDDSWEEVQELLVGMWSVWDDFEGDDFDSFQKLKREERGQCALFMDAERFRACVKFHRSERDTEDPEAAPGNPEQEMPGDFYVGFEPDWSYNPTAETVFTPRFRVSSQWPASEKNAPPRPFEGPPQALETAEACRLLEDIFWMKVMHEFQRLKFSLGLSLASITIEKESQTPPVFYYASPTRRPEEAEELLQGEYLPALKQFGKKFLVTPDIRSQEISGGVMEGGLAVFTHSPSVDQEYCLFIPLAGMEEDEIEKKIKFITYTWHDIDFDATWKISTSMGQLDVDQTFSSLWLESLGKVLSLNEGLSYLLGKPGIQERMFELSHLVREFLAKFQAKTYAAALKRHQFQREVEEEVEKSKRRTRQQFTVREMRGFELPGIITDGYTRVYREYEKKLPANTEAAHALAEQIDNIGQSLSHMASLEEQEREREQARNSRTLNQVLGLVGVLTAIPLLVGTYETQSLARMVGWLPFGWGHPDNFWKFGLFSSFALALVAVAVVVWAFNRTRKGNSAKGAGRAEVLRKTDAHSDRLFDSYRAYGDDSIQKLIGHIRRESRLGKIEIFDEIYGDRQEAGNTVHAFDLEMARGVVEAFNQSQEWNQAAPSKGADQPGSSPTFPNRDESPKKVRIREEKLAKDMERRMAGFVLERDIFDLRPESLMLPITLCLYRLKLGRGRSGVNPVSDWEFQTGMEAFGFSEEEMGDIERWAEREDIRELTPAEFIDRCEKEGISALHPGVFSLPKEA
jgi:hypothetical protein